MQKIHDQFTREIVINGTSILAQVKITVWDEERDYDGDIDGDVKAFKAGKFSMKGIGVDVSFDRFEACASLGMTCVSNLSLKRAVQDIDDAVASFGLIEQALDELTDQINRFIIQFMINGVKP